MGYLNFDKSLLVNLEYSLGRETLRTNRLGAYCTTTLAGCNTRKYHGLLIVRLDELDGGNHVLISSLDETIIQHEAQFNLGIHKYPGEFYEPKGHKYIRNFEFDTIPKHTFSVGEVILTRTKLLVENENQILVKYTLEEASSPTLLRFKPFLAFRNAHTLSKANLYANTKFSQTTNGIKMCLYEGYPDLYMQLSKEADFVPVPDWYKNIEYSKEQERGYEFQEDLYVPGYFEISIEKGESIIFSGALKEQKPSQLFKIYEHEKTRRIPRDSFINCLKNSANQFSCERNDGKDIIAGFPWYESVTRQTLTSLPGIFLTRPDTKEFESVMDTVLKRLKNGLLPVYSNATSNFDAADSPLLVFVALQELANHKSLKKIWEKYGAALQEILKNYKSGYHRFIKMDDRGLIYAKKENIPLTWMDAMINGYPVTQRGGYAVEINAGWYNAIAFALELATASNDNQFVNEWQDLLPKIGQSFLDLFWCEDLKQLADYVDGEWKDWSVRPNILLAASMQSSPLSKEQKKYILSKVKNTLVTQRGIRTLSPEDPNYVGYSGERYDNYAEAAHQGSVYPFLLYPLIKTYLGVHKAGGLAYVKELLENFKEVMSEDCVGTISESYEGNPPFTAKGSISQAWNISSILMSNALVEKIEHQLFQTKESNPLP